MKATRIQRTKGKSSTDEGLKDLIKHSLLLNFPDELFVSFGENLKNSFLIILDLHVTLWQPCWWNFHKRISLASLVCGTNMAAISLSFES